MNESDSQKKSVLEEYLAYYMELDEPGYAILVTGKWGVGKTYQVKSAIPEKKRIYVSLYGVDSLNSIKDKVLASAISERKAEKESIVSEFLEGVQKAGESTGGWFSLSAFAGVAKSVVANKVLENNKERVIIFDDLERSGLWKSDMHGLLGTINRYVEHGGFKVIVICHREGIGHSFKKSAEKIFGHTFEAKPNVTMAFNSFVEKISINNREFINKYRYDIQEVWRQSGISSLRILRGVLSDISRLKSNMPEKYLNEDVDFRDVLRCFCVFSMEIRSGNLLSPEYKLSNDKVKKDELFSKYHPLDKNRMIFDDGLVEEMFIDCVYESEKISACIENYLDYKKIHSDKDDKQKIIEPAWLRVAGFDELADFELEQALEEMDVIFKECKFKNIGEFLHVSALRFMMVNNGISGNSLDEELVECKKCFDRAVSYSEFEILNLNNNPLLTNSYGGAAYWVENDYKKQFDDLIDYVVPKQKAVKLDREKRLSQGLIDEMRSDPNAWFQSLIDNKAGELDFIFFPPKEFVDAWVSSDVRLWNSISFAVAKIIVERPSAHSSLATAWARNVSDEIQRHSDEKAGNSVIEKFAKLRLERLAKFFRRRAGLSVDD